MQELCCNCELFVLHWIIILTHTTFERVLHIITATINLQPLWNVLHQGVLHKGLSVHPNIQRLNVFWDLFWCKTLLSKLQLLRDHSFWSSHVHKTPLHTLACSLFTSLLFCITIVSCSLTSQERIYVDPLLCFIHRDTCYD